MLLAFLEIIPIGIATAVSTMPLLASIAILLSPGRSRVAWPFLIGFGGGMLLMTALFSVGLTFVPDSPVTSPEGTAVIELVIGLLLVGLAVFLYLRRRRPTRPSAIATELRRLRPGTAAGFGFVLNLRPKALILAAAAGVVISGVSRVFTGALVLIIVSVAIGVSSVAVPIVLTQARPAVMEPRLRASQAWIAERQNVFTAVVTFAVGGFFVVSGILKL